MIWKLQRVVTGKGPILAYTERHENMRSLPPSSDLLDLFDGRLKIYVEAVLAQGKLQVAQVVEDQDW